MNISGRSPKNFSKVNPNFENGGKNPKQLVTDNLRLVYQQRDKLLCGIFFILSKEEKEDLAAAGSLGLCIAAKKYDATTGHRFASLACLWIRGEMLHYLRSSGRLPRVKTAWHDYYSKGRRLPDKEAAEHCGITLDLWLEVKQACEIQVEKWQPKYEKSHEPELEEDLPHLDKAKDTIARWLASMEPSDRALVEQVYFEGEPRGRNSRRKKLIGLLSALERLDGFDETL